MTTTTPRSSSTILNALDNCIDTTNNVVKTGVSLSGDIEIGAVEIKNATDDTRATVGANGLYVDVRTSAIPTGAATSAKQDTLLTELQLKADLTETQPVSVASLPLPSGAATETTLASVKTAVETIDNAISGSEMQVDVVSSALPSGAATSAAQTTGNASLSSIDGKLALLEKYAISNIDADASPNYYGFEASDGAWYILKETVSAGADTYLYFAGASDLSTNWTNRAGLSYAAFSVVF